MSGVLEDERQRGGVEDKRQREWRSRGQETEGVEE